jgi:endoglucanase
MIDIALLSKVCKVPGAPGYEQRVRELVIKELDGYVDEIELDPMGNVIAIKRGEDDTRVMLASHMDEISFVVSYIDEEGFLRIHPLGGFDPKTLTAQRVIVHGKKDIVGVMGSKPIHIMKPEERKKMPAVTDFFIDTGLSKKEVDKLISPGDVVTRERELIEMGNCVNSKSLDNRVSVYIQIEVMKMLADKKVPYDIYATFTVQEEIGLRGAIASASGINPDFAIAMDVTLACDVPDTLPQNYITKLGKGTAIKVLDGMTVCDYRMVNFMKEQANKKKIPYQMEILPAGGTDTAGLQRHSNGGSIAGALSIPLRYMHSHIEMVNKSDIQATIDLLKACLLNIDKYNWNFR